MSVEILTLFDEGQRHYNLGESYIEKCDYDKALESHKKCLVIWEKALAHDDSHLAKSYNSLGTLCANKGSYDKAAEYYRKCLMIWQRTDRPNLSVCYYNLGNVCYSKSDYGKASEFLSKALEIFKSNPEHNNHNILATEQLIKAAKEKISK